MGLVSGFVISLWVGIGSQIYPPLPVRTKPLSLSIEGCNITSGNLTSTEIPLTTVFSTPGAERYEFKCSNKACLFFKETQTSAEYLGYCNYPSLVYLPHCLRCSSFL